MLDRAYNINLHTSLPVLGVPSDWVMHWSNLLEKDLIERRMARDHAAKAAAKNAKRRR